MKVTPEHREMIGDALTNMLENHPDLLERVAVDIKTNEKIQNKNRSYVFRLFLLTYRYGNTEYFDTFKGYTDNNVVAATRHVLKSRGLPTTV